MKIVGKVADAVLVRPGKIAKSEPLAHYPLYPERVKKAAGVQRLAELGPRTARTLQGEALLDDTTLLPMLRVGIQNQELLWFVVPASVEEATELQRKFGSSIQCLSCSNAEEDPSNLSLPLFGAKPEEILRSHLGTNPAYRDALHGIDSGRVTRNVARMLNDYEVQTQRDSGFRRMLRHPLFSVYALVFVYSALRALPVSFVKEFHGSLLLFWTIDLVTAIPYTWGVLAMLFGKKWQLRMLGAVTTVVTFVSPYVYFWLNGRDYPPYVPAVIAALTLITISSEVIKYLQERNLKKHYRTGLGLD